MKQSARIHFTTAPHCYSQSYPISKPLGFRFKSSHSIEPGINGRLAAMDELPHDDPDPVPIYILFVFAFLLCAYFAWLGTVVVRLYFYKGSLAPEPEGFVIFPAYLRDRSSRCGHHTRMTAFPLPVPPQSPARQLAHLSRVPRVNIATTDVHELSDPDVRAFLAEQQRISRLPAFVQVSLQRSKSPQVVD